MELERNLSTVRAQGFGVCSVSYDSVAILDDFARRRNITFPLISDPDSSIIRAFGLFNEQVAPGGRDYGVPHPGAFLIDPGGAVTERFFEEKYWNRLTTPAVFWRLGLDLSAPQRSHDRDHLRVRTAASDAAVSPGNRFSLFVDLDPAPGVHVYGPEVGGGYQGLSLTVEPPEHVLLHGPVYPPAMPRRLPWSAAALMAYAWPIRLVVDVSLGTRLELAPVLEAGRGLRIPGMLCLQACDNRACWPPETIALEWQIGLLPADLERVPEPLRRNAVGS